MCACLPDFQVRLRGVGVGVFNVVEGEGAKQHHYEQHARRPHVHLAHQCDTSALTHPTTGPFVNFNPLG